jgi:hypothetical protein
MICGDIVVFEASTEVMRGRVTVDRVTLYMNKPDHGRELPAIYLAGEMR